MRILLNGAERQLAASRLDEALDALGYKGAIIATAVNGRFVPSARRANTHLAEGDSLEVLAPMQGG
ncbi:sulfur carrier protein ThiS [Pelagibacterium luteolum]|uniref:Sulfur carrier protein n=1 Tax=Pelagibacterium luteolum TaxID=440168 RepID=A0A1G7W2Q6_9HYPH|nr:sulfur carrier protein ThiS [Pelagibacterium luteolum]SDG65989.1 sulfur carrier protein [Pelagibacterium luteolum]